MERRIVVATLKAGIPHSENDVIANDIVVFGEFYASVNAVTIHDKSNEDAVTLKRVVQGFGDDHLQNFRAWGKLDMGLVGEVYELIQAHAIPERYRAPKILQTPPDELDPEAGSAE